MSRSENILGAYEFAGSKSKIYDGMITRTSTFGKIVHKAIWGMSPKMTASYIRLAMAGIPEGFSGRLLEVPTGTGVLTMPLYKHLPDADITCLDYSTEMLRNAEHRAEQNGIDNVKFEQGDVAHLPFDDSVFDIVLSLNGFHAFLDKEAAYSEVHRVLKPGGTFCGCFYIKGQVKRTDWVARNIYEKAGFFTPPYETLDSLRTRFENTYNFAEVNAIGPIACFACIKGVG